MTFTTKIRKLHLAIAVVAVALLAPATAVAFHVFEDVPDDAFYADAVEWAADNGITTGRSPRHLRPPRSCRWKVAGGRTTQRKGTRSLSRCGDRKGAVEARVRGDLCDFQRQSGGSGRAAAVERRNSEGQQARLTIVNLCLQRWCFFPSKAWLSSTLKRKLHVGHRANPFSSDSTSIDVLLSFSEGGNTPGTFL